MIFTSINPPTNALGETQGRDFTCSAVSCAGLNASTIQTFRNLQLKLNEVVGGVFPDFKPLVVDGLIGSATVDLAVLFAQTVPSGSINGGNTREVFSNLSNGTFGTKEQVAAHAQEIIDALTDHTQSQSVLDIIKSGFSPSSDSSSPSVIDIIKSAFTSTPATPAKHPTWMYIAAGVVGLAALGGIGYFLFSPAKPPTLGRRKRRRSKKR